MWLYIKVIILKLSLKISAVASQIDSSDSDLLAIILTPRAMLSVRDTAIAARIDST